MAMTSENERQAALIKTTISNYVGTATIALIAGGVVLFTYVQQSFRPSYWFYVLMLVAIGALVLSFIFGGRGANTTAIELASDSWTKDTKTKAFNLQALLTLVGLIVLLVAAAVGTLASARPVMKDPCVTLLSHQLAMPHPDLKQLRKDLQTCETGRS
jgi:putative copper export protein